MYEAKVPERRGGQACLSSTGKSGDLGQPAQVLSLEWDRTARVPGPHWLLGYLSREHWGRKGLQDSGGTEFLEQLYTSTVPSETLLHISFLDYNKSFLSCMRTDIIFFCWFVIIHLLLEFLSLDNNRLSCQSQ